MREERRLRGQKRPHLKKIGGFPKGFQLGVKAMNSHILLVPKQS